MMTLPRSMPKVFTARDSDSRAIALLAPLADLGLKISFANIAGEARYSTPCPEKKRRATLVPFSLPPA
jgi:hypothetical protein